MSLLFQYCCSLVGTFLIFLFFLIHCKQLLLFFIILLFILSNCCCSSWSSYSSSTIIVPLPYVLVHPQQLLFMIIFFMFSPTPTTFCVFVLSFQALKPNPTFSNFCYVSKVVTRMLWFPSLLTFEPWFIVGLIFTFILLNQGLHPCIQKVSLHALLKIMVELISYLFNCCGWLNNNVIGSLFCKFP